MAPQNKAGAASTIKAKDPTTKLLSSKIPIDHFSHLHKSPSISFIHNSPPSLVPKTPYKHQLSLTYTIAPSSERQPLWRAAIGRQAMGRGRANTTAAQTETSAPPLRTPANSPDALGSHPSLPCLLSQQYTHVS